MRTKPSQYRIYDKALAVIDSCTNEFHIDMTDKYVGLTMEQLRRIGTGFCTEACREIRSCWEKKLRSIQKVESATPLLRMASTYSSFGSLQQQGMKQFLAQQQQSWEFQRARNIVNGLGFGWLFR